MEGCKYDSHVAFGVISAILSIQNSVFMFNNPPVSQLVPVYPPAQEHR